MTTEQKKRVKEIAIHYGLYTQKEIAVEECAELIFAIKKHDRKKYDAGDGVIHEVIQSLTEIAGEIADVMIMCEQLAFLYGIEEIVKEQIDFKIARQLERIKKECETGCIK